MEHEVQQRTKSWYQLRGSRIVTASRFGDAIGVGKGKPFDFLCSLFEEDSDTEEDTGYSCKQHGTDLEPIIHEAYDLLTGYKTRESGFWTICDEQNPLKDFIGASPDAIVLDDTTNMPVGLCEFKAPVYRMYNDIPPSYMVQIQGQMAVTGLPWCDFMAICQSKREIMLKRVYFCQEYWDFAASRLLKFCSAYNELKTGHDGNFTEEVKKWGVLHKLSCSRHVNIENRMKSYFTTTETFTGPSGIAMTFDFLLGSLPKESIDK